jgi:hypothetical protein
MASAESAKDPTTEAEKDVWKKVEQQFTTYGREAPLLTKAQEELIDPQEAQLRVLRSLSRFCQCEHQMYASE